MVLGTFGLMLWLATSHCQVNEGPVKQDYSVHITLVTVPQSLSQHADFPVSDSSQLRLTGQIHSCVTVMQFFTSL